MKDFAEKFYKSKRWQHTARDYAKSVGKLCEPCAAQGISVAGEIVHHRIELTPENINDPSITLDWSNLELVCRECHAQRHPKRRHRRRYTVDAQGNVLACEIAPPVAQTGSTRETGGWGVKIPLARGKGGVSSGEEEARNTDKAIAGRT